MSFYCRDLKGSISETLDEDEEILGSDDDEQEDPRDYTKGKNYRSFILRSLFVFSSPSFSFVLFWRPQKLVWSIKVFLNGYIHVLE